VDYVTQVNEALRTELAARELTVVYGQNVNAGSRLGGLARDFSGIPGCRVINTPNTENSLVGMGFGLMLSGIPSMYAMKQQDFVLLGVDHLVNTWNALRSRGPFVPFVIAMIVVDSGWEGPQSGFNNTGGIASLSRIPAFCPTGAADIPLAVAGAFQGGPAILAVSQRMFRRTPISTDPATTVETSDSYTIYSGVGGGHPRAVILANNFSLEQAWQLRQDSPFDTNDVAIVSYFRQVAIPDQRVIELCAGAEHATIVDDQKSMLPSSSSIYEEIRATFPRMSVSYIKRMDIDMWARPNEDVLARCPINW
jgi:hypothetical protein